MYVSYKKQQTNETCITKFKPHPVSGTLMLSSVINTKLNKMLVRFVIKSDKIQMQHNYSASTFFFQCRTREIYARLTKTEIRQNYVKLEKYKNG